MVIKLKKKLFSWGIKSRYLFVEYPLLQRGKKNWSLGKKCMVNKDREKRKTGEKKAKNPGLAMIFMLKKAPTRAKISKNTLRAIWK